MLSLSDFMQLDTDQVAAVVQQDRKRVCAFPINGTRRWYMLERLARASTDQVASEEAMLRDYVREMGLCQAALCRLLFGHGLYAVLTSLFGAQLLQRGDTYSAVGLESGLTMLRDDPAFLAMYGDLDVRVRFYGDYRAEFSRLGLGALVRVCDEVMRLTARHTAHVWLCGLCADRPHDTVADLTLGFYLDRGRLPKHAELVERYYGLPLEDLDLFIGFDKPAVFDVPLLDMNEADLYFMVAPSPYLDAEQLRGILYDHLYARHMEEQDYRALSREEWAVIKAYYALNRRSTLGVGTHYAPADVWFPTPQVTLPEALQPSSGAEEA